ncbi:MAG: 50S ribosomal protein L11 methyltransferase, partial [Verrucomicrobia bacterium]|nr:50S ribosomal protein L11 methyltransferase [Verrucomicrobiota bacterium]
MKSDRLWQISVTTSSQAEEAVAALLERVFRQPATTYSPADSTRCRVTVFLADQLAWSPHRRVALRTGLDHLRRFGLEPGPARIGVRRIRRAAWMDSWRRHFRPLAVGRRLLIRPTWSRRRARPDQAVVVLDPGLSFGTGQHPTTAFCLRQLVAWRKRGGRQSLLDVGTGSGILAIAAAKLGYSPVQGWDND